MVINCEAQQTLDERGAHLVRRWNTDGTNRGLLPADCDVAKAQGFLLRFLLRKEAALDLPAADVYDNIILPPV